MACREPPKSDTEATGSDAENPGPEFETHTHTHEVDPLDITVPLTCPPQERKNRSESGQWNGTELPDTLAQRLAL